MKFFIIATLIYCSGKFISDGCSLSKFQFYTQNQILTADTTVPCEETTNDVIKRRNFKGTIILDDQRISYDHPFLDKPIGENLIKEVSILRYLPIDSVLKFGGSANYGLLIIKTR
jgi:hypothetical protein